MLGSFCLAGRTEFARELYKTNPDMRGFIAPLEKVPFISTYPFWTTYLALLNNCTAHPGTIQKVLYICTTLFNMKMAYYPASWQRDRKKLIFDPAKLGEEEYRQNVNESFLAIAGKINDC